MVRFPLGDYLFLIANFSSSLSLLLRGISFQALLWSLSSRSLLECIRILSFFLVAYISSMFQRIHIISVISIHRHAQPSDSECLKTRRLILHASHLGRNAVNVSKEIPIPTNGWRTSWRQMSRRAEERHPRLQTSPLVWPDQKHGCQRVPENHIHQRPLTQSGNNCPFVW